MIVALLAAGCRSEPAPSGAAARDAESPSASAGVMASPDEPLALQPRGARPVTNRNPHAPDPEAALAVGDCAWLDTEGERTRLFPVVFGAGSPYPLANVCFAETASPVVSAVRYLTFAGPLEVERRPRATAAWQVRLAVPWPLPAVGTRLRVVAPPRPDERRGRPAAGAVYVYADEAPLGQDHRLGGDVDWRGVAGELVVEERGASGLSGVASLEVTLARTLAAADGLTLSDTRFELTASVRCVE